MQDYVKRMIIERDDLVGKIKRAKKAVENPPYGASANGLRMLSEQIKAMEQYEYWLSERLKLEGVS